MTVIVMTELKRALERFVAACDKFPMVCSHAIPPEVESWVKAHLNPALVEAEEALAMPPRKDPDKIGGGEL
jgi:hypothetical protein